MELIEKRRKHFVALRAQEKRNRPPTKAQKRSQMYTYLKHMGGYKHKQLMRKSYDEIQKLFDKEMKRVNAFVAMSSETQESNEKKVEGYWTEKYLQTLWKLVKTKHGDLRLEDEHERVLWGDLKVILFIEETEDQKLSEIQVEGRYSTLQAKELKIYSLGSTKCLSNEPLAILLDEIHIDDRLHFVEEPMEIMDHEFKRLKQSRIPIIKVRWNSRRGPEFTWEREYQFQKKYSHLFTKVAPSTIITEYLVNISKSRAFWSLNEDILKIIVLTTNTPYPSRNIWRICACTHQRPRRKHDQYAVSREDQYACMTRSSTKQLFTPFKDPDREFRSSRKHFKTLSLDELRSPDFDLVAEAIAETMEQYMSKTRADYGSGVARPKIEDKDNFELKGQFLKEL
ncbi:hypothetical protein Tco_0360245 [Tanacetum coccineum]